MLDPDDIKAASAEGREAVEVEAFVDAASIGPEYFEKPYVLVPGKKAEKGYVLLRETLKRTGKIGIARVVIRTREYLSAVMPRGKDRPERIFALIGDEAFAASAEFSDLKQAHATLAAAGDTIERRKALEKCRQLCPSTIAGYYRDDLGRPNASSAEARPSELDGQAL